MHDGLHQDPISASLKNGRNTPHEQNLFYFQTWRFLVSISHSRLNPPLIIDISSQRCIIYDDRDKLTSTISNRRGFMAPRYKGLSRPSSKTSISRSGKCSKVVRAMKAKPASNLVPISDRDIANELGVVIIVSVSVAPPSTKPA